MTVHSFIIAEAGVNHNGSMDLALELIDVAAQSGADAVKFQTFRAVNLVTKEAKQAAYQIENMGKVSSQFKMLKDLEFSYEEFKQLKVHCDQRHIEFLSTPFDLESVKFLVEELQVNKIKVSSGDLTNTPLLHYIATKKKPIILSTGMATMKDVHEALAIISYGIVYPNAKVDMLQVQNFYETKTSKEVLKEMVSILHCTTEYPTPMNNVNLNAMNFLEQKLELQVGLSDHTEGIYVPIAAIAIGAKIIEKHFTLNRLMEGPDHRASLEPEELKEMIKAIRSIEKALGKSEKKPNENEIKNQEAARKSVVALKEIKIGEEFTKENLTIKRPGIGMPPSSYWSLIGLPASRAYKEDDFIVE